MSGPVSRKDVLIAIIAIILGIVVTYFAYPKNLNEYGNGGLNTETNQRL